MSWYLMCQTSLLWQVLCLSGLEEKAIPEDKTSGSGFFYFSAFSRAVRMVLMSIMEVYWLSSE